MFGFAAGTWSGGVMDILSRPNINDGATDSRKKDFRGGSAFVPTPGRFGRDRRNVFDRNLPAPRFRRFYLDLIRGACLLRDFLVRRGLVSHVEGLRRVRRKKQDARFFRYARINLVQDRAAESEAFEIARIAVSISARENALAIRKA